MPSDSIDLDRLFYVADSPIHGKGLFARIALEPEKYLGRYDGPFTEENGRYVLWVEERNGHWIGRDGQNLLRYINHSPNANAEFDGFDLYAIQSIRAGEEITIHYGDEFDPE